VSVCFSCGVPEITGGAVFDGLPAVADARTVPGVAFEFALALPSLFEAIHTRANALAETAIKSGEVRTVPAAEAVVIASSAAAFLWASRGVHELFLGRKPGAAEVKSLMLDIFFNGLRPR
jgi:hypothetical protein